ncbi:MAG: hypothetical protein H6923_06530 [Alphaproteobacteria bacterium]|nr:hypothetical protein [Alphaproteobacteria bacterium]
MADSKKYRSSSVDMVESEKTYSGFMLAFKVGSLHILGTVFGLVAIFVWGFNPIAVIVVAGVAMAALGSLAGIATFPLTVMLVVNTIVLIGGALTHLLFSSI